MTLKNTGNSKLNHEYRSFIFYMHTPLIKPLLSDLDKEMYAKTDLIPTLSTHESLCFKSTLFTSIAFSQMDLVYFGHIFIMNDTGSHLHFLYPTFQWPYYWPACWHYTFIHHLINGGDMSHVHCTVQFRFPLLYHCSPVISTHARFSLAELML